MAAEDVVCIFQLPPIICLRLPGTLPLELFQQRLHLQREVHVSVPGHSLCFLDDNVLAGDLYHIPLDVDGPLIPVDVAPLQPAAFAPAHPGGDDELEVCLVFEAFNGKTYQAVPAGHANAQNDIYKSCSKPNIQSGTPTYWLRASEVYFLRAEAALVWEGFGSADSWYKQGIDMSFQENGVTEPVDDYMNSNLSPRAYVLSHYQYGQTLSAPCETTVKFEGTTEQKLEKIMIQKWIALFPNGQEAWTEWRRTGYPKLNVIKTLKGAVQGATLEGGIRRMIYPTSFSQTNEGKAIYEAALKLFNNGAGGEDKSSTRLWWDCKR